MLVINGKNQSGGLSEDLASQINEIYGNTVMHLGDPVLLWENPNPNSSFAAQTIEIDLSKYRYLVFYSKYIYSVVNPTSNEYGYSFCDLTKYNYQWLFCQANSAARLANISGNNIIFERGMTGGNYNDNMCIPLAIYGLGEYDVKTPSYIANQKTITDKIEEIYDTVVSHVTGMDLLWENPNPNAAFSEQNISINMKKYRYIVIEAKYVYSSSEKIQRTIFEKTQTSSFISSRDCWRIINYITDDIVSFGVGGYSNTNNNNYTIPLAIYGMGKYGD